jgi:hypothetical protein
MIGRLVHGADRTLCKAEAGRTEVCSGLIACSLEFFLSFRKEFRADLGYIMSVPI